MLDEEQLAGALSAHIDAILAGQPLPLEDGPEELKQLLDLADQLAEIDLPSRPAFDQHIKRSLFGPRGGGNGGLTRLGTMPLLLVLGLVALTGIIGVGVLTATLVVGLLLPQRDRVPTSTPRAPSPIVLPTPMITPLRPTLVPPAQTTTTPGDVTQPSPASTRDKLRATASPTFPSHLVGEPTESHTDMDSGRDSGKDNGDRHSSDDDEDDDD
jgi:hypothetical protein